ncbi:MAG: DeoR/GlpR family DNA-binding transcription regulator [Anaerolineales bacterium]|nr:DeoR/GlpR family DNA-binding transcription regulator [Anaerolineales bacterium]
MKTSKELFLEERRLEILRLIRINGRVSVVELSDQLGVSGATIRSDLQALADNNLIIRTHGGAVPNKVGFHELSLGLRRQRQIQEKMWIGKEAAAMIFDGDAIFLDSSSTTLAIAQYLKNHRNLTILTNSLVIAQEMLDATGVTVVMPGGKVRQDTASLVKPDDLGLLGKFIIQKGFFGAHGITAADGLTDVSPEEAEFKRSLVDACREVIIVLDGTKWGRVGLTSFAQLEEVELVITDSQAPPDLINQVRKMGIKVILV